MEHVGPRGSQFHLRANVYPERLFLHFDAVSSSAPSLNVSTPQTMMEMSRVAGEGGGGGGGQFSFGIRQTWLQILPIIC